MTLRGLILVALPLSGCGQSPGNSVPPKIAERADVIVTFDGTRHTCLVALPSEPQGSTVPCGEVVSFIKDELKVATGAIYDVRTIAHVDATEMTRVDENLKSAGYRFIGGRIMAP
jgi:hypothetical protein